MPTTPGTYTLDDNMTDLIATTLSRWTTRNFTDQVFKKTPTLEWFQKGQELIDGGESLTIPVSYGINTAGTFYEGLGIIPPVPQKNLAWAIYTPCEYAIPVAISQRELDLNAGPTAMAKMLDLYMQNALESAQNVFATVVFSGTDYNALSPLGLSQIVSATGTIGGISASSYTWWAAQTGSATYVADVSQSTLIENMMTMEQNINIWKKPNDPVVCICSLQFFRKYYLHLNPMERRAETGTSAGDTLKVGPKRLLFGETELIPDPYLSDGSLTNYWLTPSVKMMVHKNANWKQGQTQEPLMQTGVATRIRWMGANVTDKRRALGVFTYTLNS